MKKIIIISTLLFSRTTVFGMQENKAAISFILNKGRNSLYNALQFACKEQYCEYSYKTANDLARHTRDAHKVHYCNFAQCQKPFVGRLTLYKHNSKYHERKNFYICAEKNCTFNIAKKAVNARGEFISHRMMCEKRKKNNYLLSIILTHIT